MSSEDNIEKGRDILIQLLKAGKTADVIAGGLSMFPVLLPKDIIRVKPVRPDELRRGQIIVYELNSKIISHRYIKTKNDKIICKGDGLIQYDTPFPVENLLGVVIARTRNNKTVSFTNSGTGIKGHIISILTPFTGIFFHYASYQWHKIFRR